MTQTQIIEVAETKQIIEVQETGRLIELHTTSRDAISIWGRQVASTAPANNEVLAWNTANTKWEPTDIDSIISGTYVDVTGDTMTGDLVMNGADIVPNVDGSENVGTAAKTFASVHATDLHGTLQTAAQANVTSLGTLSSLTVGGDLTVSSAARVVQSTGRLEFWDGSNWSANLYASAANTLKTDDSFVVAGSTLQAPAGTEAAPGLTSPGNTTDGVYWPGSGLTLVVGGKDRIDIKNSGIDVWNASATVKLWEANKNRIWFRIGNTVGGPHFRLLNTGGGIEFSVDMDTGDVVVVGNLDLDGIPTSDPSHTGRVWNDSGTLRIST